MKNKFIPAIVLFACVTLTGSKELPCNSSMPGIQAIGIAPFSSLTKIVKGATGVTTIAAVFGANTIARFEVKNSTTAYVENGTSGGDNRSKGVKGTLPVILNVPPGADVEYTKIVEQLLNGPIVLFIEMKNGNIFVAGSQTGAEALTIDGTTGGQSGDLNGYTITFNTDEPDFARLYKLVGAGLTEYATALMPVA